MKNTVLIGANGMLGSMLKETFTIDTSACFDQDTLDITNKDEAWRVLRELKPKLVINAAAYTAVDLCEINEELANAVNGYAVGDLAEICNDIGATMVHYSTDYVFDGNKKEGYEEDYAQKEPLNAYGRSKLLGEQLLAKNHDTWYLLRTSWLYGPYGKNFVLAILNKAKQGDSLRVVNDEIGRPNFTKDLAQKSFEIVSQELPFGIYHPTNEGFCSWYDFAREILAIKQISVPITPISGVEYGLAAKRPHYSMLNNTKLPKGRLWDEALKEYLSTI